MNGPFVKNSVIPLEITDLNNLGFGVGHLVDGRTVFVKGAVTGDSCEVRLIKIASTYCVGRLETLLRASPHRLEDDTCTAADACGGCVYRHVAYAHELACKRSYVEHAFRKAGLPDVTVLPVRTTGRVSGYRNKALYPVKAGKTGMIAGFYARKTHEVVAAAHCALAPEIFGEILGFVCGFCDSHGITAYEESTGKGLLRHVYLRYAEGTGEVMVTLVLNGDKLPGEAEFVRTLTGRFPSVASVYINQNTQNTNVVLGDRYRLLWGKPHLSDILCGKKFSLSPDSFYQVNHDAAELLYGLAAEKAGLTGEETLLDLYCGAGTIGISMADRARRVIGVEIVPGAVRCAEENAAMNGLSNTAFYCGDASDTEKLLAAAEAAEGTLSPDVVIIDPPRKGTTPELISFLACREVPKIVYVSCDPDTLARDCALFREAGYRIGEVTPVDLFPRTGHVENVVLLTRGNA